MESQVNRKPLKPFPLVASIVVVLNMLTTLFLGFVSLYSFGARDPASDLIDFDAFNREKLVGLTTTKMLMAFFIIGFISNGPQELDTTHRVESQRNGVQNGTPQNLQRRIQNQSCVGVNSRKEKLIRSQPRI